MSHSNGTSIYDSSFELWNWLKTKPCFTLSSGKLRFLGYEQAWLFVLGAILYLWAREARLTLNADASKIAGRSNDPAMQSSWQLDSMNCFVSLKAEDVSLFTTLLSDFNDNIERVTSVYKWPGVAPSTKYSSFYSRTEYLRHLLKSNNSFLQLISLAESLVSTPIFQ
jgi:hypothetical protein